MAGNGIHLVAAAGSVRPGNFTSKALALVVDEIRLVGSRCGDFSVALGLLAEGAIKVRELVSRTFPLEQGLEAFQYLERPSCLKVLLAPSPA